MRKIILLFIILYCGQAFSQNATTTQLRDSMAVLRAEYRKALSDSMASIRIYVQNVINQQIAKDNRQDTNIAILARESITYYDKKYFNVIGNTVYLKVDSINSSSDIKRLDLRIDSVNNRLIPIDNRLKSLEGWSTLTQSDIDSLKAYADRLRRAVFVVPQTILPFPQ